MASSGSPQLLVGAVAVADYSLKQFYAVKLTAGGDNTRTVTLCSGAGDEAIGLLQDAPALGQACQVAVGGEAKGIAGGVFAAGAKLGTDANGKLVAKTANKDWCFAIAQEAGVDTRIVSVLITGPFVLNV